MSLDAVVNISQKKSLSLEILYPLPFGDLYHSGSQCSRRWPIVGTQQYMVNRGVPYAFTSTFKAFFPEGEWLGG